MKKVIVITGGDGFLGSHLSRKLTESDMEVYAVIAPDSPSKAKIEKLRNIHIIEFDLMKNEFDINCYPNTPDAFIHLAWIGVRPENRKSFEIQTKNIKLTMNAIKLAADIKSKKFIIPGSTFEYSYSNKIINRYVLPSPNDAYGATKVAIRYFCEVMCKQFELPFIYVVITGIYAADRIDNNVITYTIMKLLQHEKPLFTELIQKWDYVHIDDVLEALYLIILKGKEGGFYTVGHGDNWPLYNYIYKIRDLIDPSMMLGIGEIPYSSDKIQMSCVDLSEIYNDTGFVPKIPFETGIKKVIEELKKVEEVKIKE